MEKQKNRTDAYPGGLTYKDMERLAEQYPWFDSAVMAVTTDEELPAHIILLKGTRPVMGLLAVVEEEAVDKKAPAKATKESAPKHKERPKAEKKAEVPKKAQPKKEAATIDIIDKFIDTGEHKVVPKDDTPDYISQGGGTDLPIDDELITEELAQIYLDQELFAQAKAIYERLSLLYPKKSVYFAEIIEKIPSPGEVK